MLEKKPSGQRFKEHRAARWMKRMKRIFDLADGLRTSRCALDERMKRIFDLADGLRTSRCALDEKDLKDFDLADG